MYAFPVQRLCLVDAVQGNPRAAQRARRLSAALGVTEPEVITREESTRLCRARQANRTDPCQRRTGAFDYSRGWTVILDLYEEGGRLPWAIPMTTFRDGTDQMGGEGVCRSGIELHGAHGCYHRCQYCFVDPFFRIACDLETLAERIPACCAQHPGQKLFKFDNVTDTIALEPEYGASALLVPLFAGLPDRYLLLYTKSDNVEHLLDLPHGGHTIVNWSLSPATQSRRVEVGAPDTFARIEAMRKCAEAGYTVRVRFSPIIPLQGWRAEFAEMADALFSAVAPDVVTMDVIGWARPEAVAEALDLSLWESAYADTLRGMFGDGNPKAWKYLLPHEQRAEILRFAAEEVRRRAPRTPVAICNETRRMWQELSDVLAMTPENYACCCGPTSVPGHPMLRKKPSRQDRSGGGLKQ